MSIRQRSRTDNSIAGYSIDQWGTVNRVCSLVKEFCEDETGPGDGGPFYKSTLTWSDHTATGTVSATRSLHTFPQTFFSSTGAAHLDCGKPSNSILAAELLSKTNPSRAYIDLPIFIWELRELPDLIRVSGKNLIEKIAEHNLRYQFAIKPLVSDLMSLLDFTDKVDKRLKELEALRDNGLRRTRPLWNGTSSSSNSGITTNSSPTWTYVRYRMQKITSEEVWGHVKWFPQGTLPPTSAEMRKLARKAVLGLTIDGSTVWNAIPWSWLVDWFSNIGDILAANRNIVGATHSTPLIMKRRVSSYSFVKLSDSTGGLWPQTVHAKFETKERTSASANLSAHLPFLTGRQMSILSSLAVLKGGRSYTH